MRFALTLGVFMTTLFLAGAATAGERPGTAESQGETILHVFTWEDYFDSNVVNAFQKKYNCVVAIDSYDSNDSIYSALTADGAGYDVVTPSSPMAAVLHRAGLLMELDHDKLPNLKHLDKANPTLNADPDMTHSAPYTQTITGIGYNKTR